jgi:uncharacterized YkwD family protein
MKQATKFLSIALVITGLLIICMVPAFGYTTYYFSGNQYSSSANGFYNPGSVVVKYYNQYYRTGASQVIKPPVPVQPPINPRPMIPAPPAPPSTGLPAEETKMVNLVNQERMKQGVKPLGVNMVLVSLARNKSRDMVAKNYFSHTSPTYGSPFDMMRNAGVSFKTAGENIAGAATTESAHQSLMNSQGHRANILNSAFSQIGIGIAPGSMYGNIFTQMFIGI